MGIFCRGFWEAHRRLVAGLLARIEAGLYMMWHAGIWVVFLFFLSFYKTSFTSFTLLSDCHAMKYCYSFSNLGYFSTIHVLALALASHRIVALLHIYWRYIYSNLTGWSGTIQMVFIYLFIFLRNSPISGWLILTIDISYVLLSFSFVFFFKNHVLDRWRQTLDMSLLRCLKVYGLQGLAINHRVFLFFCPSYLSIFPSLTFTLL